MRHAFIFILSTVFLVASSEASAKTAPPRMTSESASPYVETCPEVNVKLVKDRIEMRDAKTGAPLIMPRDLTLYDPGPYSVLSPFITLHRKPCGFDLVYSFHNDTEKNQPLGTLQLGIITLGDQITFRDFSPDGRPVTATLDKSPTNNFMRYLYPGSYYAPIAALENDHYAMGVSLLYPALQYRQQTKIDVKSPQNGHNDEGEGGPGWSVGFRLGHTTDDPNQQMLAPGILKPGETREFVVAVRVTQRLDQWVRNFVPYRDYFLAQYGSLKTNPSRKPVWNMSMSDPEKCDEDNLYGFQPPDRRADLYGYGPTVDYIQQLMAADYFTRTMIWRNSGSYCNPESLDFNFPYQVATHWMKGAAPMADATQQFARLPAGALGLWWGRSVTPTPGWNPISEKTFNPHSQKDRDAAFAELDLLNAAGTKYVGLDTFDTGSISPFVLLDWLAEIQLRYPQMSFVPEPFRSDLFDRFTGIGWVMALNGKIKDPKTVEDIETVKIPKVIGDLLFQGHLETWAFAQEADLTNFYGRPPTFQEMDAQRRRLAALGYVVVGAKGGGFDASYDAVETWKVTIPPDIQF